ncbi:TetR/AcrR family transcriptional regulator [Sphingomonas montanisoli]|uniref:TetR/AcrR family transcriptional regulator n=1 Tax=Sphingomonas montanisoli TaxID=2606412 RepID=A0A5D9C564_9SPHN|nr:TetR/AcrR family transcriptional regulator [Sphingomonas montanisoli]TZG26332.1 TetR/AcrR family transcriptional regulator [Sphingomonas montanisoli]
MTTKKVGTRGRPRSFDPAAAVETAQTLFQQRGYDGVGVADIGKALGITPPSFYNAFGSKAALFAQVLDSYTAGYGRFVPEALEGPGDSADAVDRLLAEAACRYATKDGIAGCLVIDGVRNSSDAEALAMIVRHKAASRDMLKARFAREHPEKADGLASIVITALNGLSASARDGASEAELMLSAKAFARAFREETRASGGPRVRVL